jgi:hypothetical protein
MNSVLKRFLPIAFVAIAMTAAMHAPASADTTPVSQVCGSVDLGATNNPDAAKSFDCFNGAFQRCDSALLVATGHEGDASVTWTFSTIDGDHGCRVVEVVERATGSTKTADTFLCSGLTRNQDGLSFSGCGSQRNVALHVGQSAALQPPASQAPAAVPHGGSPHRR